MAEIFGLMAGEAPEPQGLITCDLGEFTPGTMDGDVPEPQGAGTGTVFSGGDRTNFVAIQDPALAGFKFIDKGPGFLIAGASENAKKVVLIDATGFRSLRLESESIEVDGFIHAMRSSAQYIFVYAIDKQVQLRKLYIFENASGLALVDIIALDRQELSAWLAVQEDANIIALPVGTGRVQVRSLTAPFDVIGEVSGIGRSAVATWVALPTNYEVEVE